MALSKFYKSTIIEANASFGYSNFACDPDEITRVLGIIPDEIMRKGEDGPLRLERSAQDHSTHDT